MSPARESSSMVQEGVVDILESQNDIQYMISNVLENRMFVRANTRQ